MAPHANSNGPSAGSGSGAATAGNGKAAAQSPETPGPEVRAVPDESADASGCGDQEKGSIMPRFDVLRDLDLNPAFRIVDLNLHEEPTKRTNIREYFSICKDSTQLHVTTSCFTLWKQNKRTNGHGKVIPALRNADREFPMRIFFFDDNIEWGGTEDSQGLCNLRDVATGDFVEFAEGCNGFSCSFAARHTVVHHSSEFCNVIVKANILDALEDDQYFIKIVKKFTQPREKVLVFMDVNSTIVCNDSSAGKDLRGSLLSVMFELIEVRPLSAFDFTFEAPGVPESDTATEAPSERVAGSVRIERPTSLKQLVKDLTGYDHGSYSAFWRFATCSQFIQDLTPLTEICWTSQAGRISPSDFVADFERYLLMLDHESMQGCTRSWFKCYETLAKEKRHAVVLNSFGVDTRKVVLATVPDERQVMQITVNYNLWSDRDVKKFESQYRGQLPQGTEQISHPMVLPNQAPSGRRRGLCGDGRCLEGQCVCT